LIDPRQETPDDLQNISDNRVETHPLLTLTRLEEPKKNHGSKVN